MGIFHKKDGQRPAQKGQKCDFGEKSAYIGRRLGAKIGVSQKKRNRRFLCSETSEIRLSVTDHTFYPQREGSPPGGGDAGAERTAELLGRNGAQRCGASGGSVVSAGGRHAGAGGAQAVQQLPCRGLSEVTAGQKFRRLYGGSLRFFAPCRFSQGAAAHRKNRRGRKNATFGRIFLT